MRQTVLAAAAAFVIGGIATGAALSQAEAPVPPAAQADAPAPPAPPPPWAGGWWHHPGMEGHGWEHHGDAMRAFALIYRQPDRGLAPADVQKIAEAFLLWNGNHSWKVTNVSATADGPIGFSLTTPEGSVIAKFTMDPHSGRIHRVG